VNEAYQHFFFHYTATPLLVVETSHVDLEQETGFRIQGSFRNQVLPCP
jgi:hypothetical protein